MVCGAASGQGSVHHRSNLPQHLVEVQAGADPFAQSEKLRSGDAGFPTHSRTPGLSTLSCGVVDMVRRQEEFPDHLGQDALPPQMTYSKHHLMQFYFCSSGFWVFGTLPWPVLRSSTSSLGLRRGNDQE